MSDDERPENPLTSKSFLASAGIVGLIAVLGIVVIGANLISDNEGDEDGPAAIVEAAPDEEDAPEPAPSDSEASMCGLQGSDETTLDTAPQEVTWEFVGTMRAPANPDAGPGLVADDGFRQCYAHSPTGALLASANMTALGTDPKLVPQMLEELVAEGTGQDAALAAVDAEGAAADPSGVRMSIVGFNLMGYGSEHARVDLALEGSNGVFMSYTVDMKWEDGDWKRELAPTGDSIIPAAQIPDASGYIPWSAEG
ncbi:MULTISPECIES: hypothetical protein [unclassified Nocardiopsis]|uniref:hypothetical protein n=1 Tax=unclassified Nocardiopsis TaxID=2649073 RepID=UPI0013570D05|nr:MULTISPECIES: hypothetical protein [unclassified Nocardiopsis]